MNVKCEWLGCTGTVDRNGRCLQCEVDYLISTKRDLLAVAKVRGVKLIAQDDTVMIEKNGLKLPIWEGVIDETVRNRRELQPN